MRIALVQMSNAGSVEQNLAKSLDAIAEASRQGADLVLFPEVQLTEFFPQYPGQDKSAYRVELQSQVVRAFQDACKDNAVMAVPNLYLKPGGDPAQRKGYDASLVIDREGTVLGVQKMVHIAQAHQFYEQDYYLPADDGFRVFDTDLGRIGVVVCFDRHYPESIRSEAVRGAELILIPAVNTKREPMELFEQEIRVQAFQNSAYVAMCNRVGREDDMDFAGESIIVAPNGQVIAKADDVEQILYADLDLATVRETRTRTPYLTLRRPEFYA